MRKTADFDTDPARERGKGPGTVVILATGGTIAGVGLRGKATGYRSGALEVGEILRDVPQLTDIAPIKTVQLCNVNSDDMTGEIWLRLARTVNEMAKEPEVAGFVVTHGTDTLEETAYFLTLTVKTVKPVVLTGSMRPATSISADGPMNLYEAVCVAASPAAVGRGVLAVFSDHIYSARSVTKTGTYRLTAISSGEAGAAGIVRDDAVTMFDVIEKCHTISTEFDVSALSALPRVAIVYFAVDADPELLRCAASRSDGIVIAGAGAGEYSMAFKEAVDSLEIPVVISSRIDEGLVAETNLISDKTVAAGNLPPQKAAVLLRLALTRTKSTEKIREIFRKY